MRSTWDIVLSIGSLLLVTAIFIWVGYRLLKRSADPFTLFSRWLITAALIGIGFGAFFGMGLPLWMAPPLCAIFGIPIGLLWAPAVGSLMAGPLTGAIDGGRDQVDRMPLLSMAQARRQRGFYAEAIEELNRQLEKFPGDFMVLSMIAAIQAEDLKDIAAAEATMEQAFAFPKLPPQTHAAALNMMADWRLKINDLDGAKVHLKCIVVNFPNTPQSHQAEQRLAHMASPEQYQAAHESKTYSVKAGLRDIGLASSSAMASAEPDFAAIANGYVKHLEKFPLDMEIREKLAVLYAESYQRVNMAADQLEIMISRPNESPKNVVRWLNLLATLHAKYGNDLPSAEQALRRIIALNPKAAAADMATTRLANLRSEFKSNAKQESKTLTGYEQDIGLKRYSASGENER